MGKILEEVIFYLINDLGAKNIEWRKGGQDVTDSDGGRDIEATFYNQTPTGEFILQKYWIEIKGRTKTLSKQTVIDTIMNSKSNNSIDVLVIATNSFFSNPTRDWVSDYSKINPYPTIVLWDRNSLEKMIIKYPSVVVRFWENALTTQGKIEAFEYRFWNQFHFIGNSELIKLWNDKENFELSYKSMLMLVSSELINGDSHLRNWLMNIPEEKFCEYLISSIPNIVNLHFRSETAGIDSRIWLKTFQYIIKQAIFLLSEDTLFNLLWNPFAYIEDDTDIETGKLVSSLIISPAFHNLISEFNDTCINDCKRISTEPSILSEKDILDYWNMFHAPEDIKESDNRKLVICSTTEPCYYDLCNNSNDYLCPLTDILDKKISNVYNTENDFRETIHILKKLMLAKLSKLQT